MASDFGKAWYEILEDTSEFNSVYSYILITKKIESIDVEGLFSQKWDLVIDMDPDSDIAGLAYSYTCVTGINPKIRILDAVNSRRKIPFSHIPYWVMANGTSDIPDSVVDPKKWGAAHGKYLANLLEQFQKEYSKPVKAFVYPMEDFLMRHYGGTLSAVAVAGEDTVRAVNVAAFLPAEEVRVRTWTETGLCDTPVLGGTRFFAGGLFFRYEGDALVLSAEGTLVKFDFSEERAFGADLYVQTGDGGLKYLLKNGIIREIRGI